APFIYYIERGIDTRNQLRGWFVICDAPCSVLEVMCVETGRCDVSLFCMVSNREACAGSGTRILIDDMYLTALCRKNSYPLFFPTEERWLACSTGADALCIGRISFAELLSEA